MPRKDTNGHALARRMKANAMTTTICTTLGIGRATVYGYLGDNDSG